jgi:hypothetical protein
MHSAPRVQKGSHLGQSKLTVLIRNTFRVASAKKKVKAYTDTRGRSALSAFRAALPILPRNGRPKTEANHRRAHSALWPHILRRKVWLNTEAGQRRERIPRRAPALSSENRRRPKTEKDQESFSCPWADAEVLSAREAMRARHFLDSGDSSVTRKFCRRRDIQGAKDCAYRDPGDMRHQSYPRG